MPRVAARCTHVLWPFLESHFPDFFLQPLSQILQPLVHARLSRSLAWQPVSTNVVSKRLGGRPCAQSTAVCGGRGRNGVCCVVCVCAGVGRSTGVGSGVYVCKKNIPWPHRLPAARTDSRGSSVSAAAARRVFLARLWCGEVSFSARCFARRRWRAGPHRRYARRGFQHFPPEGFLVGVGIAHGNRLWVGG